MALSRIVLALFLVVCTADFLNAIRLLLDLLGGNAGFFLTKVSRLLEMTVIRFELPGVLLFLCPLIEVDVCPVESLDLLKLVPSCAPEFFSVAPAETRLDTD